MIEFGDWQIRRYDKLNLTLYHRHAGKANNGKGAGVVKFRPTGNYFPTVEAAVMFALRRELMDAVGTDEERVEMAEYIHRVEATVDSFKEWLSGTCVNAT